MVDENEFEIFEYFSFRNFSLNLNDLLSASAKKAHLIGRIKFDLISSGK